MRNRFLLVLSNVLMLGLLAACQSHPAGVAAPAVSGIELREPRQGIYAAGQPAAGDWQAIAARGVATVVNLRTAAEMQGRDEAAEVRAAGMNYVEIPVAGADGINDANARLLRAALAASAGPVLVHCASGNRVGGLLALSEARYRGAGVEEAIALGRKAGMGSTEARVRALLETPEVPCSPLAGTASVATARAANCP